MVKLNSRFSPFASAALCGLVVKAEDIIRMTVFLFFAESTKEVNRIMYDIGSSGSVEVPLNYEFWLLVLLNLILPWFLWYSFIKLNGSHLSDAFLFFIFIFGSPGDWTQGWSIAKLCPQLPSPFKFFHFEAGSKLPRLASNLGSSCLSFLSSLDYSHVPLLGPIWFFL